MKTKEELVFELMNLSDKVLENTKLYNQVQKDYNELVQGLMLLSNTLHLEITKELPHVNILQIKNALLLAIKESTFFSKQNDITYITDRLMELLKLAPKEDLSKEQLEEKIKTEFLGLSKKNESSKISN